MTEQSTYEQTKTAVLAEVEARDYGTSTEDFEAYAGIAAGSAAAGVCAAYGQVAASPVCYAVGSFIGEYSIKYAVKAWNALFSDDSEFKAYQKRQAEKARQAIHELGLQSIELVYWTQWQDSIYKLMVMHHELWPHKKYTYSDAVNELIDTSTELNKRIDLASDSFVIELPFNINIETNIVSPIKGPPFYGKLPLPFWTFYFNTLFQYPHLEAHKDSLFDYIMKYANQQLNNLQDSYSALLAVYLAQFETDLAYSPEAISILNENQSA